MKLTVILEEILSSLKTQWFWISPDNKIYKVPELSHKNFIMNVYRNEDFGWDYDKVFDKSMEDGWVRGIYEYKKSDFKGELSLCGFLEDRIKNVLKNVVSDLYRYGNVTIYLDFIKKNEYKIFSKGTAEGKNKLINYLK